MFFLVFPSKFCARNDFRWLLGIKEVVYVQYNDQKLSREIKLLSRILNTNRRDWSKLGENGIKPHDQSDT